MNTSGILVNDSNVIIVGGSNSSKTKLQMENSDQGTIYISNQ